MSCTQRPRKVSSGKTLSRNTNAGLNNPHLHPPLLTGEGVHPLQKPRRRRSQEHLERLSSRSRNEVGEGWGIRGVQRFLDFRFRRLLESVKGFRPEACREPSGDTRLNPNTFLVASLGSRNDSATAVILEPVCIEPALKRGPKTPKPSLKGANTNPKSQSSIASRMPSPRKPGLNCVKKRRVRFLARS